jgi:hypothetical protein
MFAKKEYSSPVGPAKEEYSLSCWSSQGRIFPILQVQPRRNIPCIADLAKEEYSLRWLQAKRNTSVLQYFRPHQGGSLYCRSSERGISISYTAGPVPGGISNPKLQDPFLEE